MEIEFEYDGCEFANADMEEAIIVFVQASIGIMLKEPEVGYMRDYIEEIIINTVKDENGNPVTVDDADMNRIRDKAEKVALDQMESNEDNFNGKDTDHWSSANY